jgi:hypothetical protein
MVERKEAESSPQRPSVRVDTAKLCALVYSNGKIRDRYAMTVDDLVAQTGFEPLRFKEALAWGIGRSWISLTADYIQLTAAGIYAAKVYLNLPH